MKNQSILEVVKDKFKNVQNLDGEGNRHRYHSRVRNISEKQPQVLFLDSTNQNFIVVGNVINNRTAYLG